MSQPVFTSLDPLEIRDGRLDIGHGNWAAGGDLGELTSPKWMAVVTVDGHIVHGVTPGMPSVPASVVYRGESGYGVRLVLDLRQDYTDGKEHVVNVYVYAAQFFQGWGDHPEDAWEWGHYSAKNGEPAVLTTRFTLGTTPAPTPTPAPASVVTLESAQQKASAALYELVTQWRRAGRSDAEILDTLVYQLIKCLGTKGEVRTRLKAAIRGVLG